jgi:hypothetical protein
VTLSPGRCLRPACRSGLETDCERGISPPGRKRRVGVAPGFRLAFGKTMSGCRFNLASW